MLLKVLFFGSSDYCLPILESLNKNFQLVAIVTKPGTASKTFSLSHNIKVLTPKDKKELSALKNAISSCEPDLTIVADYGLIIPEDIFDIPLHKTLNIHFSKLPHYRGPSPVQYTILSGAKTAWISVILMAKELDTGDIIWQNETELKEHETSGGLYQKLFNIAATELPGIINKYKNNELKAQKQDHSLATYTKHLNREDGFVPSHLLGSFAEGKSDIRINASDFPKDSILFSELEYGNIETLSFSLERACRAFTPWPGLWTEVTISNAKKRLKILQVHIKKEKLILDLVQLEGKKPVSWKQFQEGYKNLHFL